METVVIFSKIKEEIIKKLKDANGEIKVAVAWLTDEDIIRVLTQKKAAGLDIRIAISNSIENFRSTIKFKDYLKLKGRFFISTNPFLHHKFCIIDNKVIINGSYNWSYSARSNEENIMVITIDNEVKEDALLLSQFNAKHQYLCDKCSVSINDYTELKGFQINAKDNSVALSQLDEREIILRQEFENDIELSLRKSAEAKIYVSDFLRERMKIDGGGVEFVKRILRDEMNSGDMKSGFRRLEEIIPHRVELSLEYIVSRPKYAALFRSEEILFCKSMMKKYDL